MTGHARVVVIGGGAVGCSCLYHLAERGWTDALLLERDELTSGSTWHAAGNCPTFSANWGLLKLQKYSTDLYRRLAASDDHPIGYHVTGSLRLAHHRERLDEFRHVRSMARANGLEYEILAPDELPERYPFIVARGLQGALWDPADGDIDPAQLTQALAKAARGRGCRVQRATRVTGLVPRPGGNWRVVTDRGEIDAEFVVNAAGYRAGEVMAMLGRHLPIAVMSHQYLVTEDIPELAGRAGRLPLLRDPDASYYLRQERHGFILGPYERQAMPMWRDGIPDDFAHQLWDADIDRLSTHVEDAMARVPLLAAAGIRRVVNGPIPYAPDGNPFIGPEPGLRNFFHCNTFSFGIAQAGGAGKALAEWIVDGRPEWDLWSVDRRRYTDYATRAYAVAKAVEVYQNEYAPAFPFEERPAGRPLRVSPLHDRLKAKGGRFGVRGGWERALYFAAAGATDQDTLSFRRDRNWFATVGEEVAAVRGGVGILDLPGFTKFDLSGAGTAACLDRLVCSRLPRPGRTGLAYVLDPEGGIVSEFTLTRLDTDRFYVVAAAAAEWHDRDVLERALPSDGSVRLEDLSARLGTLVVAGPHCRDVLARVTDADLSNAAFPWLSARFIEIGAARLLALRMTYVGELGWELHAPVEHLAAVYDAVWQAGEAYGIRDFGVYALDSMRLDKCYRGWKSDLEPGYSVLEASLDRFVDFDKPAFVGREAILAERRRGPTLRLVPLLLEEPGDADAPPCSTVLSEGRRVGIVTSGGWSHTLDRSVALAYVSAELAVAGTRLQVDVFGAAQPATVACEPLYDPGNVRMRA